MKAARVVAISFLAVVTVSTLLPSIWTSQGYEEQFRDEPNSPPSTRFLLGTDALGRDRLARLLFGTRVSLALAPGAALLSCGVAAVIGGLAGLAGGWIERIVLGGVDLFMSLPWLFLLLTVRATLPLNVSPIASLAITFLLLGLLGWPASARIVRTAVSRMRSSDFILQAQAMGSKPWRLLFRQLFPNVMPVLLAQFWVGVPVFILAEATLGMLGLGISEPMPSWGSMLRELEGGDLLAQPWIATPVVLLMLVVGCFQFVLPREDYSV